MMVFREYLLSKCWTDLPGGMTFWIIQLATQAAYQDMKGRISQVCQNVMVNESDFEDWGNGQKHQVSCKQVFLLTTFSFVGLTFRRYS